VKKALPPIIVLLVMIGIYIAYQAEEARRTIGPTKPTVRLVYVEWSSATASTNVIRAVIQEKLGYPCTASPVSAAAMFQSIASGDQDAMTCAWLPVTHRQYMDSVSGQVKDLGINLSGTRIGLVVPEYVDIYSIDDLRLHAEEFDNQIIGIDPGAGIMEKTEQAIDQYGLQEFTLMEGSGATMTAALDGAIQQGEWVVVTGWTPHWMWNRYELKYLQDPKKVYGEAGEVHTIARIGLKNDMPEIYQFLTQFKWTPEDMQEVMAMNRVEGTTPYENAVKWINDNPELVSQWLAGITEEVTEYAE